MERLTWNAVPAQMVLEDLHQGHANPLPGQYEQMAGQKLGSIYIMMDYC